MINLPTKENPITKSNQVNRLIVQWDRETEIPNTAYDFHTVVRELNEDGSIRIISDVSTGAIEFDRMTDDQKTILNSAIGTGTLLAQNSALGQVVEVAVSDRNNALDKSKAAEQKEAGYEAEIERLYGEITNTAHEVEALMREFVSEDQLKTAQAAFDKYLGKPKDDK